MTRNKNELGRSWNYLTYKKKPHLRFLTIIIGAVRVNDAEIGRATAARKDEILREIGAMIARFRSEWTGLTRGRHLARHTWRGAFEVDLRRDLEPNTHAYETIASMGCDVSPLGSEERMMIVHVHLVLDGSRTVANFDDDGEIWANRVRDILRGSWPGVRRTQVKGLYAKQTVQTAVTNLFGYCNKQRCEYAEGGYDDEPTRYTESYEPPWFMFMKEWYQRMNFSNSLEFRSKL